MKKITRLSLQLGVGAIVWAVTQVAGAVPIAVYNENFDGGAAPGFSGVVNVESVQGYPAPFGGNFLRNDSVGGVTTLSLSSLPAHDSVDINFLLAVIDSWDGDNTTFGPDIFNVRVDGASIFSELLPNAIPDLVFGQFGFSTDFRDRGLDMGVLAPFNGIAHSASTLTIDFFASGIGFQGGLDESFALENVQVLVNATATTVPEPGTLALLGIGLLGMGFASRRKNA